MKNAATSGTSLRVDDIANFIVRKKVKSLYSPFFSGFLHYLTHQYFIQSWEPFAFSHIGHFAHALEGKILTKHGTRSQQGKGFRRQQSKPTTYNIPHAG